jgi:GNAT superfamily N-acetyltransferase
MSVPSPAAIGQGIPATIYYGPMDLRRATLDDLPLLVPLFDAYRQFYRQPPDAVAAERFLRERLAANESVIFLAVDDGGAVGFVQLYATFWSIAARRAWILNDLFVQPERRGTGAGRALLDRARLHAVETGAGGLSLATERTNLVAQRLYESLGWRRDQEYYHYELDIGG